MSDKNRLDIHEEYGNSLKRCILIYTPIFIVLACLVYLIFLTNGKTLVRYLSNNRDAFAQRYIFVFEFKRFLENLFSGGQINTWDWSIGLGYDGFAFNSSALFSPSSYVLAFTPEKYVDVVYSLTVIFRVYLSGLAFMLFARKCRLSNYQIILGAVLYSFCPWIIDTTILQGTFVKASMMFPLIMLGEEKIIRRESPLLFTLTVGYTVLTIFSFSYMIGIGTLIYFFVRMVTLDEPKPIVRVIRTTAIFIFSGIAGIMTAGIGLVVTLLKFGETTTTTGKAVTTVWSFTQFMRIPLRLMTWNTVFGSSSVIGIAAIGIVLIPLIVYKAFRRDTNAVMTVLLFIFVAIPAVNSMFNFFSYASGRWMFMLLFFYSLSAASCFDKTLLENKKSKIAISVVFALYIVYILWIQKICEPEIKLVLLFSCIAGVFCIGVIWAFFRGNDESGKAQKAAEVLVLAAMCLSIAFNYNMKFSIEIHLYPEQGEVQDIVDESPQRVGPVIDAEDDDFYRIEQARIRKVNDQMFYGNRSDYVFFSNIDVGWIKYNELLGNNQSYYKRVRTKSNDNRFGLDFLQSIKYFIGNYGKKKGLSRYAGFGFEPYKKIDGVEVLKNKYFIGPGCMFYTFMRESEWEKLSYADREMAMLMAVIVPDDHEMPDGMEELKSSDIDTGVKEVPYKIFADEGKTHFAVTCENDDDHQLLMSFENVQAAGDFIFTLNVRNGNSQKLIVNSRGDERGFPDMRDLTVNLGSGKRAGEEIEISLEGDDEAMASGITYDDLKMYSMPLETYRKCAEKLVKQRFVTDIFENDRITGTVNVEKKGILYIPILDNYGWDVYVDGNKVKRLDNIDVAFMGAELEPGEHQIELNYHTRGFWMGVIVSVLGFMLMFIVLALWKKYDEK